MNMSNIRYETANPPKTLIAATPVAPHPRKQVGDPLSRETMRIPAKMTTPDKALLVDMRGLNKAAV